MGDWLERPLGGIRSAERRQRHREIGRRGRYVASRVMRYFRAIYNTARKSFVIHTRVVLDSLYSKKPKPEDVVAEDFFTEPGRWRKGRPEKSRVLRDARERIGTEIAHLSYRRIGIEPESKPWPFREIADGLLSMITKFLELVPAERLSGCWNPPLTPGGIPPGSGTRHGRHRAARGDSSDVRRLVRRALLGGRPVRRVRAGA
jgi:hypothetical protein